MLRLLLLLFLLLHPDKVIRHFNSAVSASISERERARERERERERERGGGEGEDMAAKRNTTT